MSDYSLPRARGFTLIEVMIVTAIIAIITAVAYPSYQEHVRNARRSDAQIALLELSQFMERYYTSRGRYVDGAGVRPALPYTEVPRDGATKYYDVAFNEAGVGNTATAFVLQATPRPGSMAGDACGSFRISSTGVRTSTGTKPAAQCWRQ